MGKWVEQFHKIPGKWIKSIASLLLIVFMSSLCLSNGNAEISKLAYAAIGLLVSFCMLIYTVFRFEDCWNSLKKGIAPFSWIYAFYFAVATALLYNPMIPQNVSMREFLRQIGQGTLYGYDVGRVIQNFTTWLVLFAVSLFLFLLFFNHFRRKTLGEKPASAWKSADNLVILAASCLLLRAFSFFYKETYNGTAFSYSGTMLQMLICLELVYIVLRLENRVSSSAYRTYLLIAFSAAYPPMALLDIPIGRDVLLLGIQMGLMAAAVLYMKLTKRRGAACCTEEKGLFWIAAIAAIQPGVLSFFIEFVNILNQHGVFVTHLRRWYLVCVMGTALVGMGMYFLFRKKDWQLPEPKQIVYPCLLLGITALSVQLPLENIYTADLFESANYSVLIGDFLNFGDIPIVDHYGGHMMSGVWEGIIYGLVNKDYAGAVLSPYAAYSRLIVVLCFYWLVKKIWNADSAFWTTLFFPFLSLWEYFGQGILIAVAILAYIRKNTYGRAILVWLACVWVALYRLDLGAAFIIAGVFSLACYIISQKNWKVARQLGITLLGYAVAFGGLWCVLCWVSDVNPVNRLMEFLALSASNQNWSYSSIGNPQLTAYAVCYLVLPFGIIAMMLYLFLPTPFRKKLEIEKWILLILMGVSYLGNFSRGLVRHSVVEMSIYVIVFSAYIFIAMFTASRISPKLFVPALAAFVLCGGLLSSANVPTGQGIADVSAGKTGEFVNTWKPGGMWEQLNEEQRIADRVQLNPDQVEVLQPIGDIFDQILKEEETYVDYANISFAYSYFGKRSPVYVSQSPLQLAGDYTQECFIDQLRANLEKVPVCLLPMNKTRGIASSLDFVANNVRYYRVAEFIYQNYVPLCAAGDIAIWCLHDRYEEMRGTLLLNMPEVSMIEYGYDDMDLHTYGLHLLPQVWADLDQENAINHSVVSELKKEGSAWKIENSHEISKEKGNYLVIRCDSSVMANVKIRVGKLQGDSFTEKYCYTMTVQEGEHTYLIRISNDYYWYSEDVNAISTEGNDHLTVHKLSLLEGD